MWRAVARAASTRRPTWRTRAAPAAWPASVEASGFRIGPASNENPQTESTARETASATEGSLIGEAPKRRGHPECGDSDDGGGRTPSGRRRPHDEEGRQGRQQDD